VIKPPPNILILQSEKTELKKVEKFLNDVFWQYQLSKDCFNKVYLCISEAIINSIVHGNKEDRTKKVELNVDCIKHLIAVKITDQGDGFDTQKLPDPTQKMNILNESGRGIHIIKSMAEKVKFNSKGNSLQFQIVCK
jgi:serine/threonine-protein kinase RsbW